MDESINKSNRSRSQEQDRRSSVGARIDSIMITTIRRSVEVVRITIISGTRRVTFRIPLQVIFAVLLSATTLLIIVQCTLIILQARQPRLIFVKPIKTTMFPILMGIIGDTTFTPASFIGASAQHTPPTFVILSAACSCISIIRGRATIFSKAADINTRPRSTERDGITVRG
jgi:hypothetical protein